MAPKPISLGVWLFSLSRKVIFGPLVYFDTVKYNYHDTSHKLTTVSLGVNLAPNYCTMMPLFVLKSQLGITPLFALKSQLLSLFLGQLQSQ